jgi:dTDP-4-amino-4,6-dideoxygalactose transaminase
MNKIPFNRPFLAGRELDYIRQAVEAGQLSAAGSFTARCEAFLQTTLSAPRALLTTSCTHALELAALLLDLRPDDEIIVPSFTFVSTLTAFTNYGARPRFVDIRPDTLNLDERLVEAAIGPRTRAIVPVHYGGVGCALDDLVAIAMRHRLTLIEDNAHGLFGRYRGRTLGTFGALAAHSFHETKNLTCGEGGALVINDPALVARAEIIREKGTDRAAFLRGEVGRYTWVDRGSSYGLSEILAAFLWAQLEARDRIYALRAAAWRSYDEALRGPALKAGWILPSIPPDCEPTHHLYHVLLPSRADREALTAHLAARQIHAIFHYQPLHLSKMGRAFGGKEGDCPVTESVAEHLLRLPLYNGISSEEQARVIGGLIDFLATR